MISIFGWWMIAEAISSQLMSPTVYIDSKYDTTVAWSWLIAAVRRVHVGGRLWFVSRHRTFEPGWIFWDKKCD